MDELPEEIGQGTPGVVKLPGAFCDKAVTVAQTIAGKRPFYSVDHLTVGAVQVQVESSLPYSLEAPGFNP
jgi:hypothetical protein